MRNFTRLFNVPEARLIHEALSRQHAFRALVPNNSLFIFTLTIGKTAEESVRSLRPVYEGKV